MKKLENKILQKQLGRSGISLIVLVIIIIVILILAAAVILTINNNNPISEVNTARYESDRANMQAVFTNVVAKVMTQNKATISVTAGQINSTVSGVKETTGEISYTVKNAMDSDNSSGKIVFDKGNNSDTVFYTGKLLPIYAAGDTNWYVDEDGNILLEVSGVIYGSGKVPPFSQKVADNVSAYYGKKVLNYETGNETLDSQIKWQIFHADENNIYLIATDYILNENLPKARKILDDGSIVEYEIGKYDEHIAYISDGVLSAYKGSENIIDARLQALNSMYFEYLKSNNVTSNKISMKAVAYMMDLNIWDIFAGEKAEYAIGGPTVEMLFDSYNKKYGTDYRVKVKSEFGYYISNDGGVNWDTAFRGMVSNMDTQYSVYNDSYGMWLASPCGSIAGQLLSVGYNTYVWGNGCQGGNYGFRPIVCLNSNVKLKAVEGGYIIQ